MMYLSTRRRARRRMCRPRRWLRLLPLIAALKVEAARPVQAQGSVEASMLADTVGRACCPLAATSKAHWRLPWVADSARPAGPLTHWLETVAHRGGGGAARGAARLGHRVAPRVGGSLAVFTLRGAATDSGGVSGLSFPPRRLHAPRTHGGRVRPERGGGAGAPRPSRTRAAVRRLQSVGYRCYQLPQTRRRRRPPLRRPSATSFPSYHTTQAFIGATVLAEEYGGRRGGGWIMAGGFTLATATGAMRLLNNRHWSSDVLAGAGIGILSTESGICRVSGGAASLVQPLRQAA